MVFAGICLFDAPDASFKIFLRQWCKFMITRRELSSEELLDRFDRWLLLSGSDFVLSPYFQIPFYDIYRDDNALAVEFLDGSRAVGYALLKDDGDALTFPVYEPITPYFDIISDNGYREEILGQILSDMDFSLGPILESSPTLRILRDVYGAEVEEVSAIEYLPLPDSLDSLIYRSRKRDRMVRILRKMGRKKEFRRIEKWNLPELMVLSGMYLLPHEIHPFVGDLLSITTSAGILRIYCVDEEACAIFFIHGDRAYLWHLGGPSPLEDDLKMYAFMKVLEVAIGEGAREMVLLYREEIPGFKFSSRRTYRARGVRK